MAANGVRRVRVHVPAHDGWPESVRGVGSATYCPECGAVIRARTHLAVREKLATHREKKHG